MNRNRANWSRLSRVGMFIILTAPYLHAADQAQSSPAEVLALDKVRGYLRTRGTTNTSLQDERAAKELIGKVYRGLVVVGDVKEGSKVIVITDQGQEMNFWIEDAKLKEKAAQLLKGDKILITARLKTAGNAVETLFIDVQSFDVQPKDQTEQRK